MPGNIISATLIQGPDVKLVIFTSVSWGNEAARGRAGQPVRPPTHRIQMDNERTIDVKRCNKTTRAGMAFKSGNIPTSPVRSTILHGGPLSALYAVLPCMALFGIPCFRRFSKKPEADKKCMFLCNNSFANSRRCLQPRPRSVAAPTPPALLEKWTWQKEKANSSILKSLW